MNIMLWNATIFLATLSIHELGHVFFGIYSGCENGRAIVFDTSQPGPYAELSCSAERNIILPEIGGVLLTFLFGFLFMFIVDKPQKNFVIVIIGLSILFGAIDLSVLTGFEIVQFISILFGLVLISTGELLTSSAYLEIEHTFFKQIE